MSSIFTQPWFWPAVIVTIGLPIVLIGLSELATMLQRANSRAAPIVVMVRNYLVPVAALLVLLAQPGAWQGTATWPKVIWTVFGLLVIVVTINAINHLVFHRAEKGSWRDRFPTIFSDLIRFVLIVVGIALVFYWVWNADVAGVFAALGVTSIVVGFALQNAVGSVVSGLFLIFESPFELGDWIDMGGTRGRVVEVNWRAVHVDTGNGIVVVPTAELAGGSFTNLTRATDPYSAEVETTFSTDDPPLEVRHLLIGVGRDIGMLAPTSDPQVVVLGNATYRVSLPLISPGDETAVRDAFLTRLWYAARRAGLHLDGDLTDDWNTTERLQAALRQIAPALSLHVEEADRLIDVARLERYAVGESILRPGDIPTSTRFILEGRVVLGVPSSQGFIEVTELSRDDAIGLTALTRSRTVSRALAVTEVEVVEIPVDVLDQIVRSHPSLARDVVRENDNRVQLARKALAAVGVTLDPTRRVMG